MNFQDIPGTLAAITEGLGGVAQCSSEVFTLHPSDNFSAVCEAGRAGYQPPVPLRIFIYLLQLLFSG